VKALIKIDGSSYDELIAHLLPRKIEQEQAAFLFARMIRTDREVVFEVIEQKKLYPGDFVIQKGDYLEMSDETRAAVIKRAHDLSSVLIELHSHLGPWPATFSPADRSGLGETVPHMWWRLKARPYIAIVTASSGFDALLWLDNPKVPRALDALIAGDNLLKPTNNSLEGWA
jgi:hypothetical protein